jgi:hypothetical protein
MNIAPWDINVHMVDLDNCPFDFIKDVVNNGECVRGTPAFELGYNDYHKSTIYSKVKRRKFPVTLHEISIKSLIDG